MRKTLAVLSLSSCLPLTGCMSSLRIKTAPQDLSKPKGLPFYAKVGACKQQTVWLEYRYEISADGFGPVVVNQKTYNQVLSEFADMHDAGDLEGLFGGIPSIAEFVSDKDKATMDLAIASDAQNLVLGGKLHSFAHSFTRNGLAARCTAANSFNCFSARRFSIASRRASRTPSTDFGLNGSPNLICAYCLGGRGMGVMSVTARQVSGR